MEFDDIRGTKESDYNNLIIVDGLNLAFRYKHSGTKQFATQYFNTVKSLANSYLSEKIIILGDWGSEWRKSIYPEYKANRTKLREEQTEDEAKEFEEFLNELQNAFDIFESSDKYLVLKFKGCEADDIAAYIVRNYSDLFEHTWLISSDKDWDLLISDNVSRFSFVTRKEITKNNWNKHYDYPLENHIDIKVLQGDKGDNVPNAEGIGGKRAYNLIREYGSIFDIYESIPLPGKQKFITNLNNFKEQLLVNCQLMDLKTYCADALMDYVDEIDSKVENYIES